MSAANGENPGAPELGPEALAALAGAGALDADLQYGMLPPEAELEPGQLGPEESRLAAIQGWRDLLAPAIGGTARLLAPGWGLHDNSADVGALAEVWAPVCHKWMPESISGTIERVMSKYALEYTALMATLAVLKAYQGKPLKSEPAPPPLLEASPATPPA